MLSRYPRARLLGRAATVGTLGALGVAGALGFATSGPPGASANSGAVVHAASWTRYDQHCDDDDYFTTGHNRDRSDDGCDTTRYDNTGHNGASAPDSWVYGHGRRDGDEPFGSSLFGGM